jgi:hypothetical protein
VSTPPACTRAPVAVVPDEELRELETEPPTMGTPPGPIATEMPTLVDDEDRENVSQATEMSISWSALSVMSAPAFDGRVCRQEVDGEDSASKRLRQNSRQFFSGI